MSDSVRTPYILKMQPHFVSKIWGGRNLEEEWGKRLPDSSNYGESWEVSDLPGHESRVVNGPLAGETLSSVGALWGAALLGVHHTSGAFPLLVKLLDAQEDLSIQVHPKASDCLTLPNAAPKDETWIILRSNGGSVYRGFRESITPERFTDALERGTVETLLTCIQVEPFDLLHIEPGTIHGIGAGVQLLEIQQPSDTTYRVWDYGRPRELHTQEALQVLSFDALPPTATRITPERFSLQTEVMTIEALRLTGSETILHPNDRPMTVTVIEGSCSLCEQQTKRQAEDDATRAAQECVSLVAGETAVIPAACQAVALSGDGHLVWATA